LTEYTELAVVVAVVVADEVDLNEPGCVVSSHSCQRPWSAGSVDILLGRGPPQHCGHGRGASR
jgi:hypothetical protein